MKGEYIISKINKTNIHFKDDEYDLNPWIMNKEDFDKVATFTEEEIIGYTLIKDLLTTKSGTKVDLEGYYLDGEGEKSRVKPKVLSNTEWFEPIYKPKKVTLIIGSQNASISISKEKIIAINKDVEFDLAQLRIFLDQLNKGQHLGFYDICLADRNSRIFRVGCEEENNLVSYNEVELVVNTYDSL